MPQSPSLDHQQTTECSKSLACLNAGAVPGGMVLSSTQLGEGERTADDQRSAATALTPTRPGQETTGLGQALSLSHNSAKGEVGPFRLLSAASLR